jgi:H+/Cl- antiporter ClcA
MLEIMEKYLDKSQQRTLLLCLCLGVLSGTASAGFLWSLAAVTKLTETYPSLIFGLPLVGLMLVWVYGQVPVSAQKGYNAVLQSAKNSTATLSPILSPLVWGATLLSHLVGASVGREGTAVQVSGGIAAYLSKFSHHKALLVQASIAAGFGSVFGTPWAGLFFCFEVVKKQPKNLFEATACALAVWIAHYVCLAWGIEHTVFPILVFEQNFPVVLCVAIMGLASGFIGLAYVRAQEYFQDFFQRTIPNKYLLVAIGSLVLLAIYWFLPSAKYQGLSLNLLQDSFTNQQEAYAFLAKLLLTVLALSIGFKGGEVTPLFVIGACLGSFLSPIIDVPVAIGASVGMVGVFAAASACPLACAVLGAELFGFDFLLVFLLVNYIARRVMKDKSIYKL